MIRKIQQSNFYSVAPLREDLDWGVTIAGLDASKLANEELRSDLYNLWIREGVIVFQGIDSVEAQLELSRVFGPLRDHPAAESMSEKVRELIDVRYEPATGWLMEVDGEQRGSWLPWHSDLVYVDKINHGGILRPLTLPSRFGETGFIDKINAYNTLPDHLKEKIEGLHVVYKYDLDVAHVSFGKTNNASVIRYSKTAESIQNRLDSFPTVIHPMVFTQPETGRKVLNVSPWFAKGIYEMPGADGDALLQEIAGHCVNGPGVYLHPWKMGEMVLWDNWRMLHSATGCPADEVRYLQRTTIGGDYGLGRIEPGVALAVDGAKYLHV